MIGSSLCNSILGGVLIHRAGKMLFLFGILSWYISLLHQAFIVFRAVEPPCLDALSVDVWRAPQSPLSTVSDLVDIGVGTKGLLNESTFFVDLSEFGIGAKAGHADWIDVGVAPLCASLPSFSPVLDLQNVGWYSNPLDGHARGPNPKSISKKKTSTANEKENLFHCAHSIYLALGPTGPS